MEQLSRISGMEEKLNGASKAQFMGLLHFAADPLTGGTL